jgi:hypothetical protein
MGKVQLRAETAARAKMESGFSQFWTRITAIQQECPDPK